MCVVWAAMVMGLVKGDGFAFDASVLEANPSRYRGKAPDETRTSTPNEPTALPSCAQDDLVVSFDTIGGPNDPWFASAVDFVGDRIAGVHGHAVHTPLRRAAGRLLPLVCHRSGSGPGPSESVELILSSPEGTARSSLRDLYMTIGQSTPKVTTRLLPLTT
jgi:hypothetical protein